MTATAVWLKTLRKKGVQLCSLLNWECTVKVIHERRLQKEMAMLHCSELSDELSACTFATAHDSPNRYSIEDKKVASFLKNSTDS